MTVTCGIQASGQAACEGRATDGASDRFLYFGTIILVVILLAGCAVSYGFTPKVAGLKTLSPGVSTEADVLLVLGEPRGKGVSRLSPDMEARSAWFYEYVRGDGMTVDVRFLIVLFDKGVYDGYLWFFSDHGLEYPFWSTRSGGSKK